MTKISVGILGVTGKMGCALTEKLQGSEEFELVAGWSKMSPGKLRDVFQTSQVVIDFSQGILVKEILQAALQTPKPLVLCTSGWSMEDAPIASMIQQLAKGVSVVLAPNTSTGGVLQHHLVQMVARFLDESYDIGIFESHHRKKIDKISGTAQALAQAIKKEKSQTFEKDYKIVPPESGGDENLKIQVASHRVGSVVGEHEVSFISDGEKIVIRHSALERGIFVQGAIKILLWLKRSAFEPGLFTMADVLGL
jgi:4-hydroxy-tetrahydrodipicolinate reductase